LEIKVLYFNPKTREFILGHADDTVKGNGVRSSHAEEYFDVHQTNNGYDESIKSWIGTYKEYRHGIVHFAPAISGPTTENWDHYDGAWHTLQALKNCGATMVRGFPGSWEQLFSAISEPISTQRIHVESTKMR
jgi:hypothetical protein